MSIQVLHLTGHATGGSSGFGAFSRVSRQVSLSFGAGGAAMEERFWPFPIVKPEAEWNEFDRNYIAFMQTAYAEGYRPRDESGSCISVGMWGRGRSASLVFRGSRNGWEPFLGDAGRSVGLGPSYGLPLGEHACVCVRPPFRGAAHLALEWMRGRSLESLLGDFEFVGGYPTGIVLRGEAVKPAVVVRNE